jgi:hypothetical protein
MSPSATSPETSRATSAAGSHAAAATSDAWSRSGAPLDAVRAEM